MNGILFLTVMIFLLLAGVPVAYGLGISALLLMLLKSGSIQFHTVAQMSVAGINSFTMLCVPLFLMAGKLMNTGGITKRLFDFAKTVVGFLPGGLGHVNIVSSVIFAGMSGTAVADAGGLGAIEIQAMKDAGFDDEFACAVTCASSTIGPIIPPSLPLVVYGTMASCSVGALFIAGIIPGILMALAMMLVVTLYAVKKNYPREPVPTLKSLAKSIKEGILPLMTPVIIIGGIYSGFFTATEAAVIAVLYSFLLSFFVYKEMTWPMLVQVLRETVKDSATIGIILATSSLYGNALIRAQIPQQLLKLLTGSISSPMVMFLVLNLFLLIVGCFMETTSAITILMPLLNPIIAAMHINPVHFGIVMVFNLMIGVLTPPFGMCLFVTSRVGGVSVVRLSRALVPWIAALLLTLLLITYMPQIALCLPHLTGLL